MGWLNEPADAPDLRGIGLPLPNGGVASFRSLEGGDLRAWAGDAVGTLPWRGRTIAAGITASGEMRVVTDGVLYTPGGTSTARRTAGKPTSTGSR